MIFQPFIWMPQFSRSLHCKITDLFAIPMTDSGNLRRGNTFDPDHFRFRMRGEQPDIVGQTIRQIAPLRQRIMISRRNPDSGIAGPESLQRGQKTFPAFRTVIIPVENITGEKHEIGFSSQNACSQLFESFKKSSR